MTAGRILSTLLWMLPLAGAAVGAISASSARDTACEEARQVAAQWLSHQLDHTIGASQVLTLPDANGFEGCSITRARPTHNGRTSLSLRCPTYALPQLLLLDEEVALAKYRAPGEAHALFSQAEPIARRSVAPMVRRGTALRADWRTDGMHALLDVIAMDTGSVGAEIRVRIAHSNRVIRARILNAHTVSVVSSGASGGGR